MIWRNISLVRRVNFSFFHTVRILKFFSSNRLLCNFFSKAVAFTKFLPKKCERVNFRNFHTLYSLTENFFREINSYLLKPLLSRNFWQKGVWENFLNVYIVLTVTRKLKSFSVFTENLSQICFVPQTQIWF